MSKRFRTHITPLLLCTICFYSTVRADAADMSRVYRGLAYVLGRADQEVWQPFYERGNLTDKSALDWQRAAPDVRFASAGNLASQMWMAHVFKPDIHGSIKRIPADLLPYTIDLAQCLDAATEPFVNARENRRVYKGVTLVELAVKCAERMNWSDERTRTEKKQEPVSAAASALPPNRPKPPSATSAPANRQRPGQACSAPFKLTRTSPCVAYCLGGEESHLRITAPECRGVVTGMGLTPVDGADGYVGLAEFGCVESGAVRISRAQARALLSGSAVCRGGKFVPRTE